MVARNAQTFQTTQRCRSADHRRLLGAGDSFLKFFLNNNINIKF